MSPGLADYKSAGNIMLNFVEGRRFSAAGQSPASSTCCHVEDRPPDACRYALRYKSQVITLELPDAMDLLALSQF